MEIGADVITFGHDCKSPKRVISFSEIALLRLKLWIICSIKYIIHQADMAADIS
jgi:hypothetical protein